MTLKARKKANIQTTGMNKQASKQAPAWVYESKTNLARVWIFENDKQLTKQVCEWIFGSDKQATKQAHTGIYESDRQPSNQPSTRMALWKR